MRSTRSHGAGRPGLRWGLQFVVQFGHHLVIDIEIGRNSRYVVDFVEVHDQSQQAGCILGLDPNPAPDWARMAF